MTEPTRYRLILTRTAPRQLAERLPERIAFAAYEFVNGPLLENPHRVGKRLVAPLDDRFAARRGTYRVLYQVDDVRRIVTVVAVGPRSDIYRAP
jgi:mRNA-degrading endonuclease RelE of RelBE toxin-antitoxin system